MHDLAQRELEMGRHRWNESAPRDSDEGIRIEASRGQAVDFTRVAVCAFKV